MFLCTSSEYVGTEIKTTVPFITSQKIKYLGVNLKNHAQGLYAKNYTMLMKEVKEDVNKCRDKREDISSKNKML